MMKLANLAQRLVRLLYPYGSLRTVCRGPVRGAKFVVEPGMGFTYAIGAYGGGMDFLLKHLHSGMTVFDVGANRGQMALFFAKNTGLNGKVFSFEPVPEVFDILRQNALLNNFNNLELLCLAVSDKKGKAPFIFSKNLSTQGKIADVEKTYIYSGSEEFEVETRTLDDIAAEFDVLPDLIKIDVEGAGAAVLRGAKRILESDNAPAIFIELHGPEEQQGMKDYLLGSGYVLETLDGMNVEDPTIGWHGTLWCYKKVV